MQFKHVTITIEQDTDAGNPRTEWDNVGKMVCWHRRYNLGDKHDFASAEDFDNWAKRNKGAVILPLYLYDHSGITMRTGHFGCPWDSGQVGWIYADSKSIRKEWKGDKEAARKYLQSEVETYDQYLTGDVWGYIIEGKDGENLDSCFGFFGRDHCEEEANSSAEHFETKIEQTLLETQLAETYP